MEPLPCLYAVEIFATAQISKERTRQTYRLKIRGGKHSICFALTLSRIVREGCIYKIFYINHVTDNGKSYDKHIAAE